MALFHALLGLKDFFTLILKGFQGRAYKIAYDYKSIKPCRVADSYSFKQIQILHFWEEFVSAL
jgi:hypothetical protein